MSSASVPPVGIGGRFAPVPGARLVQLEGGDGIARLPAVAGTPVHAVIAGEVLDVPASAEESGLLLRGADGVLFDYAGITAATVAVGAQVRAGDVIGAVGPDGLELCLSDAEERELDAVEFLLGATDPNELGYAAADGMGIDPDDLDRELAGGAEGQRAAR